MKLLISALALTLTLNAFSALPEDVERLWESRADKATLEKCLGKFEELHRKSPGDRELLVYLSRGNFLLGELTLKDESAKMKAYERSKKFGEQALSLNPRFQKLKGEGLEKAAAVLTKEDVPAAFWTAAAIGRWSGLNGAMSSLKHKDPMLALVARVEKLDPGYFYGAVYRFWAGFYALAPRVVGGDMKKSKEYFEKVQKLYPEYIGTKVALAEQYYVEKDDQKKFRETLREVVGTPLAGPKDIAPENFLEQKKAEMLLKKESELF